MKKILILVVVAAFALVVSCGAPKNSGNSSASMSKDSDKNSYVEGLKTSLDQWNADIIKLERKADKFKGKIRADYNKELAKLRIQRDEINQKLEQIKISADKSWETIKEDIEVSKMNLQKSISNVQAKFK